MIWTLIPNAHPQEVKETSIYLSHGIWLKLVGKKNVTLDFGPIQSQTRHCLPDNGDYWSGLTSMSESQNIQGPLLLPFLPFLWWPMGSILYKWCPLGSSSGWDGQVPEDLGVFIMKEQILVLTLKVSFSRKIYTGLPVWNWRKLSSKKTEKVESLLVNCLFLSLSLYWVSIGLCG